MLLKEWFGGKIVDLDMCKCIKDNYPDSREYMIQGLPWVVLDIKGIEARQEEIKTAWIKERLKDTDGISNEGGC